MNLEGDTKRGSPTQPLELDENHPLVNSKYDDNNHQSYSSTSFSRAIVVSFMTTLAGVVLVNTVLAYWSPFSYLRTSLPLSFSHPHNSSVSNRKGNESLSIDLILKKAAMPDNTIILSPLNKAWIEKDSIFDLFLESFRIGNQTADLIKHLVVVALDPHAFDHCLKLDLNCYLLITEGVDLSAEAHFMSPDYLKIVWKKIDFLRIVLEKGYNFIFTDADIMWFRNPLPRFYPDSDFQVACDEFRGNPSDLNNMPNTGLMYVKSSNRTIEFYKFWYKSREIYGAKKNQDAFNIIKYDPFVTEVIGLEMKFLDTDYFGGFCQSSRNFNLIYTLHANCCAGLDNKINDLGILLQGWRNYLKLPQNLRQSQSPSWTVPQRCGPSSFQNHTGRKSNDT